MTTPHPDSAALRPETPDTPDLTAAQIDQRDRHLGTLLRCGLITPAQQAHAQRIMFDDESLASPAELFHDLLWFGVISEDELSALRERVARDAAFAQGKEAAQILQASDNKVEADFKTMVSSVERAAWGHFLRGPLMRWLVGGTLVFAAYLVWQAMAHAAPACQDSAIDKALRGLYIEAGVRLSTNPLYALAAGSQGIPLPTVSEMRELGYAKDDRIRACVAQVQLDQSEARPSTFTIQPDPKGSPGNNNFVLMGANATLVQTRFGNLDAEGYYIHQARPLGRAAVTQAVRERVKNLDTGDAGRVLTQARERLARYADHRAKQDTAPKRARELPEVEPLADCQAAATEGHYTCRLMVEYNDPLMQAIAGAADSTVLQGDFTFVRNAKGEVRVAENFSEAFLQAIQTARADTIKNILQSTQR